MTSLEYGNASIKGLKSFLIKDGDMKIALELKTVSDLAVWLENSPYKSVVEGKTVTDVENALFKDWINTNRKILKLVPENTRGLFSALISAYEIESLKTLVNAKTGKTDNHTYVVFLSKRLSSVSNRIIEAETVESMVDVLGRSEYGILMKRCLEEKKDISRELDRYYFENLWTVSQKLPDGHRDTAEKLLGPEIDAVNIMSILRSRARKTADCTVIPVYYNLRKSVVRECTNAEGIKSVVSLLGSTKYGSILNEAVHRYEKEKSLFPFEQGLRRYVIKLYRKAMLDVLGIGVPLAYLKFKGMEITNLRSIVFGLGNGLGKDAIKEMLLP